MTSRLEQARAALAQAEAVAAARTGSAPGQVSTAQTDRTEAEGSPEAEIAGDGRLAARVGQRGSRRSRGGRGGTARRHDDQGEAKVAASPPLGPPDPEADPEAVARAIVLRQLTLAPRSRAQLQDKLRARNCPDDVAARVLDRFAELGLVDDQAYADTLVRTRRESKGLARRALAHELRRHGVSGDIVAESLMGLESDEEEQARRLVDKRLRALHGLDPAVQTRRLAGMLARKGYSAALSYRVIREALAESHEHRRD